MTGNNNITPGSRLLEKITGLLILVIAFLAVTGILTNLDVSPDYYNIQEDTAFLGENLLRLTLNTYIWLLNALLIILLGPLLMKVFLPPGSAALYSSTFMICSTGIIYLFYAIFGFTLLQYIRDIRTETGEVTDFLAYFSLNSMIIRQKLHLSAFTTSGISTILIGIHVIRYRQLPVFIGWLVLAGGLMYAVFGWFSIQNLVFSSGRLVFILSMIIFGSFLVLTGIKARTQI